VNFLAQDPHNVCEKAVERRIGRSGQRARPEVRP
jgi:hypothetical protein